MIREIQTIGKVRHRNLIRLEDFWLRKEYGFLLYNYMKNGSLHDVLHETRPPLLLEWNIRYKIALGTAQGLSYLHFDCDPAIIHRDIKPMNILLDSELEPHISDFGVAKLLDESVTSTPSSMVQGTIGYMAPERAFSTKCSKECDVYAYGIVLLELVTRKKVLDPPFGGEVDIVGWVRSAWIETQDIEAIVDPSLVDEFVDSTVKEQVKDVLLVALRCTEREPSARPSMRDVVKQLMVGDSRSRSKHA
ncbi:UNVERIFIED_CONTAM: Receptor-like protein kinase [Sesamum radiatum]|uniref:non-specific serine/threonine protein kinase n=1 Tax=Sesamum radiatum TaxID=300843 RepID=A0AAW2WHJ1_SESRA